MIAPANVVEVHELDDPTVGWCTSCGLPSVVVQHWALVLNGVPLEVVRTGRCTDCGEVATPD